MCGGTIPVLGILAVAPYLGTGSDVLTMVFNTLSRVSNKAQNNLGESTHLIGMTRLMQMVMQLS